MAIRGWSRILWVFSALLLLATAVWADSQARIVRLSYVNGDVQIDRGSGGGYERALLNMPIVQGTRLWTREGAQAEVEFEDGTTIRLAPDSMMQFPQLGLRSSGATATVVDLQDGTFYFDVLKPGDDEFEVQFPHRSIALERSVRFRAEVSNSDLRLAVFKGELRVSGDNRWITVKKNESISFDPGDPNRYQLANVIQPMPFDSWNDDRERFRTQYSTASAGGSSYYSPYYSDLNYYGSNFYDPIYGWMWRPNGFGYGWDPFSYGGWAWYPGYGYTWVSGYPWGWAPFRTGSWVFIQGRGWCWQRPPRHDPHIANWQPLPAVKNVPAGFVLPQPPSHPPANIRTSVGTDTPMRGGQPFVGGRDHHSDRDPSDGAVTVGGRTYVVGDGSPATNRGGAGTAAGRSGPSVVSVQPTTPDGAPAITRGGMQGPDIRRNGGGQDQDRPRDRDRGWRQMESTRSMSSFGTPTSSQPVSRPAAPMHTPSSSGPPALHSSPSMRSSGGGFSGGGAGFSGGGGASVSHGGGGSRGRGR
ncbi:MAG TPA: FecR family protein [Terriglobales bacterium]|nr:FecR family protein [Terriglobales bacterium]